MLIAVALAAGACTVNTTKRPAPEPAAACDPEPVPTELAVITLANAAAQELANTLQHVFSDFGLPNPSSREPQPVIAVDSRTNSLVIRASAAHLAKLRELIAQLDRPVK
jgi:type II secretory pathway component GspD/PulD (secretin)